MQQIAVTPKSFITINCRSVLPPEIGNDRRAERLRAVMRAQPAGEQAVAVGVLNDVARVQAARREAAHHHVCPHANVLLGVGDDDGFAGGAGRGVQAHDVPHRAGKQPERIGVAQIRLHRERQPGDVVQRPHVGRASGRARPCAGETAARDRRRAAPCLAAAAIAAPAIVAAAENPAR